MAYIVYTLALASSFILLCEDFLDGIKAFLGFAIILIISIFCFPAVTEICVFIFESAMYIFAALLFLKLSENSNATVGAVAAGAVILFDVVVI